MKNAKDMADKLQRFVVESDLSINLGKKARIKCEKDYSENAHMKSVISILKNSNSTD